MNSPFQKLIELQRQAFTHCYGVLLNNRVKAFNVLQDFLVVLRTLSFLPVLLEKQGLYTGKKLKLMFSSSQGTGSKKKVWLFIITVSLPSKFPVWRNPLSSLSS